VCAKTIMFLYFFMARRTLIQIWRTIMLNEYFVVFLSPSAQFSDIMSKLYHDPFLLHLVYLLFSDLLAIRRSIVRGADKAVK